MHRLYYSPAACSLAVHIVLEEIGAPYETEIRSAQNSEGTSAPDYLALNPKGRVPALTGVAGAAGGAPGLLTEAPAILNFLALSHPQAGLLPDDPSARARVHEWLNWLSGQVHGLGYGALWRPQRFVDDATLYPAIETRGLKTIVAGNDHIERILSDGRDWAVPGAYTIVDPFLLVFQLWGRRIGLDMQARWPTWAALSDRTLARPAVRRALDQEGLT